MTLPQLTLSLQWSSDFEDHAQHRQHIKRHHIQRVLRHALGVGWVHGSEVQKADITVRICGLSEGLLLNQQYRHKAYATNILTFAYHPTPTPIVAADLVLCGSVVAQEADATGQTLLAYYSHLLVHGALHALGWDHEIDEQAAHAMEQCENRVMQTLGFIPPYDHL